MAPLPMRIPRIRTLTSVLARVRDETCARLARRPRTAALFASAFPLSWESATECLPDGTTFVFTGDIPAMWLRDSAAQLRVYLPWVREDGELQEAFRGLIARCVRSILIDPYANSFNKEGDDRHWDAEDLPRPGPHVWERKYEVDSLCYPVDLIHRYRQRSDDGSIFDEDLHRCLWTIVDLWTREQDHDARSDYRFIRPGKEFSIDALPNGGRGRPSNRTGMTWSGFRPSDDSCRFGYLIPSNMFAAVALGKLAEIARTMYRDGILADKAERLGAEIRCGIDAYAVSDHPRFGPIYCYETDGYGNRLFMDDANIPSLLSIPYLEYAEVDDPVYRNTRRFALSPDNPYYNEGRFARGIGSPHTNPKWIWHLSLAMRGLTSADPVEIDELLTMFENTDAETGLPHEAFDPDDPSRFTRPWFGWAASLYAQFVLHAIERGVVG